jgi:hypothetical protein
VRRVFIFAILLCVWLGPGLAAQAADPLQNAQAAVARITVPNRDGFSLGSGSLVAVDESHGLVVTNWHVVQDASGPITVSFPNGFRSQATLLKTDRDWDLAALAIARPNVQPIPLANEAARPGEPLTIAGYGSGSFRMSTGRCTQYVSPGGKLPFEMVEVSTAARQGDSGGPILNSRGELSGVLFGSSLGPWGQTTGSYCGRVRWFLAQVTPDFQRLPDDRTQIAGQQRAAQPTPPPPIPAPGASQVAQNAALGQGQNPPGVNLPSQWRPAQANNGALNQFASTAVATQPPASPTASINSAATQPAVTATSRLEGIKTILALIGIAFLFFHGMRLCCSK